MSEILMRHQLDLWRILRVRRCERAVCIASSSGTHRFVYITATELSISGVAALIASAVFNITERCLKRVGRQSERVRERSLPALPLKAEVPNLFLHWNP